MENNELKHTISEYYGFREELIESITEHGLWAVRFIVNGIKYYGCVPYHGAEPQLFVEGYTTSYYWHGSPVTEAYYNEFIKNKCIRLQYLHRDSGNGDWEWKDNVFNTPEEAEKYISSLENPEYYTYDIYE